MRHTGPVHRGAVRNAGFRLARRADPQRWSRAPGSNFFDIKVGSLQIDSGGQLRARGSTTDDGGSISIEAVDFVQVNGVIDVSGLTAGEIDITANNNVGLTGASPILAQALDRVSGTGGDVNITAGSINVAGPISSTGGSQDSGGSISLVVNGDATISSTLDSSGGDADSGDITINAGGNTTIAAGATLNLSATGFGFGGDFTLTAGDSTLGNGVGNLVLQGGVSSVGGNDPTGGGDGGDVNITTGSTCQLAGAIDASSGTDGNGGMIEIDCGSSGSGTMTVTAPITSRGGNGVDAGGGDVVLTARRDRGQKQARRSRQRRRSRVRHDRRQWGESPSPTSLTHGAAVETAVTLRSGQPKAI